MPFICLLLLWQWFYDLLKRSWVQIPACGWLFSSLSMLCNGSFLKEEMHNDHCLFAEERRIGIHLRPSSSSFTLRGAATARSWSRSGSTSSSRSTASPSGWQESTAPGSPPSTQSSTLSDIRPSCCEFLLFRLSFESSCKGGLELSRGTLT